LVAFLDTNVLIYAAGSTQADGEKRRRSMDLIATGDCAVSGQVLAEFYVNATRATKLNLPHNVVLEWLEDFRRFPVVAISADLVSRGAAIADRYQISYRDGAIVAAAQEIGADTLYSEDLNAGQRYGSVRIVNPFAA
jgi:predicted nucleic acid-binding protein